MGHESQERSESEEGARHHGYVAVSPRIYANRIDILNGATRDGRLVTLPVWLDEPFVHNNDGAVLKVRTVLQDIADREGAHIISLKGHPGPREIRGKMSESLLLLVPSMEKMSLHLTM